MRLYRFHCVTLLIKSLVTNRSAVHPTSRADVLVEGEHRDDFFIYWGKQFATSYVLSINFNPSDDHIDYIGPPCRSLRCHPPLDILATFPPWLLTMNSACRNSVLPNIVRCAHPCENGFDGFSARTTRETTRSERESIKCSHAITSRPSMSTSSVAWLGGLACLRRHIPGFLYVVCILTLGLAAGSAAKCHNPSLRQSHQMLSHGFFSSLASFGAVVATLVSSVASEVQVDSKLDLVDIRHFKFAVRASILLVRPSMFPCNHYPSSLFSADDRWRYQLFGMGDICYCLDIPVSVCSRDTAPVGELRLTSRIEYGNYDIFSESSW